MSMLRLPTAAGASFLILIVAGCGVAGAESVRVREVVDGDTLVVESASGRRETVRLIGVDTPELRHPSRPTEYFAEQATAFVTERVEGKQVRLERDPETGDRDKYGRLLRYVYVADDELLNALLIRRGYGYALTRFPFSGSERFRELEGRARDEGLGVWAGDGRAEIRWIHQQGTGAFEIYPMTNRHWAIAYAGHVKTHLPANQLVRQLNLLLALLAEHGEGDLVRALKAHGYAALPAGDE